jgi:pyrimidine deaminase RibD-like protein
VRTTLPLDDRRWLREAIELSRNCPPAPRFNVGAVLVAADGTELSSGFSRATDPHDHAEEVALAALGPATPRLASATMYTSLEPCSKRAARPRTCAQLILDAGIGRVVFAWREPEIFVDCEGAELLRAAGVEVVELPEFAADVRRINSHLLG